MTFSLRKYSLILILISVLFTSCTLPIHTTIIRSNPTGAKLYINDQDVGYTPYTFKDTSQKAKKVKIKLVKEGYLTFETSIRHDERVNLENGGFLYPGSTMAYTFEPEHVYDLKKIVSTEENTTSKTEEKPSKADRIREFKKLLDDKIITQEEFDKEKQKILDEK